MLELKDQWGTLLKPFSEAAPAGVNTREDEALFVRYSQIRDIRKNLRREEREASADENANARSLISDWAPVIQESFNLLNEATKDIEIASWLVEGLVRKYGFEGLYQGLQLLVEMLNNFGSEIHPHEIGKDNQKIVTLAAIKSLSGGSSVGSLILPINISPWFKKHKDTLTYWHYLQAQKNPTEPDENIVSLSSIQQLFQDIDRTEIDDFLNKINLTIASCDSLESLANALDPESELTFTHLRNLLIDISKSITRLAGKKISFEAPSIEQEKTSTEGSLKLNNADTHLAPLSGNHVQMRQTAINHLQIAYQYFKEAQPHSPVTYSLQRILSWCDMNLAQLIDDLLPDSPAKKAFCKITGVPLTNIDNKKSSSEYVDFD